MFLYNMSKLPVKVAFSFSCGIAKRFNTQNRQCGSWCAQPSPTSVRPLRVQRHRSVFQNETRNARISFFLSLVKYRIVVT